MSCGRTAPDRRLDRPVARRGCRAGTPDPNRGSSAGPRGRARQVPRHAVVTSPALETRDPIVEGRIRRLGERRLDRVATGQHALRTRPTMQSGVWPGRWWSSSVRPPRSIDHASAKEGEGWRHQHDAVPPPGLVALLPSSVCGTSPPNRSAPRTCRDDAGALVRAGRPCPTRGPSRRGCSDDELAAGERRAAHRRGRRARQRVPDDHAIAALDDGAAHVVVAERGAQVKRSPEGRTSREPGSPGARPGRPHHAAREPIAIRRRADGRSSGVVEVATEVHADPHGGRPWPPSSRARAARRRRRARRPPGCGWPCVAP